MFNYKVIETIHESDIGISSIYKIKHVDNEEIYALKVIGPLDNNLSRLMFEREIASLYQLNDYDSIVRIHSHEITSFNGKDNMGLIALEYIDGKTLEQAALDIKSPMQKFNLCYQMAEALTHAHDNSVLHRDVKPSNIMVSNNTVKIIDFGISKIKTTIETGTLYVKGTSNYCAPEVASGHEATEKSDIYSLGAVFFNLLTNEVPTDPFHIQETIATTRLELDIKNLLSAMLDANPMERPADLELVKACLYESAQKIIKQEVRLTFKIDTLQIDKIKRTNAIENLPYAKITAITLPEQFENPYALYNDSQDCYEFIGKELYMKCRWTDGCFIISEIYSMPTDTMIKLRNRFLNFDYIMVFGTTPCSSKNANHFINQLKNYNHERASAAYKQTQFNNLFDKWRTYLDDCIKNTRKKSPQIKYSGYEIDGAYVHFTVEEYINGDIDNLSETTEYSIEITAGKLNKTANVIIGTYYNTNIEDEVTTITLKLTSRTSRHVIVSSLKKTETLFEDFAKKISSFKKQFRAIYELEKDNYKSKSIKDIILTLQEPTRTSLISPITYLDSRLDEYQCEAVKKSIESDSLALIQGPPGTGKTSVIKEIINQFLEKPKSAFVMPKILLVSQSHTAVDNVLEGIDPKHRIVRIGSEDKFSKYVYDNYSLDNYESTLFSSIEESGREYFSSKLHDFGLTESSLISSTDKEALRLRKIKELQTLWFENKNVGELSYHIINSALIIAGTCTGYLSNEHIKDITFDCVIVDEAAKASTPELLLAILNSKKIILVGDHYQLPPFSDSSLSPLALELATNPEYKLFDLLYDNLPDTHKQTLQCQYRMIKNIGDMISEVFYDGSISTGIDDESRMHGIEKYENYSIVWHDTSKIKDHSEKRANNGSYSNYSECDIIIKVLTEFSELDNASSLDIGVITGYKAQKNLVQKTAISAGLNNKFKLLDINTVDAFQGRENDIIIFSTVRTERTIGFQKEKERINVAFSRAKKLLIVCGDFEFISNFDDEKNMFIKIENYMNKHSDACKIVRT